MSSKIHSPEEFLQQFCKAACIPLFDPTDRACVIVRSPANYGEDGTVIIEWEGSPPRFPIYFGYGVFVEGQKVDEANVENAVPIIRSFLNAHPANPDGTPVWIGTRFKERS
jgi:hypothetical protein